jgi:hypothetical protein
MADAAAYDAPLPVATLFPRSLMDVRDDEVVSSGEARRNTRHKSGSWEGVLGASAKGGWREFCYRQVVVLVHHSFTRQGALVKLRCSRGGGSGEAPIGIGR